MLRTRAVPWLRVAELVRRVFEQRHAVAVVATEFGVSSASLRFCPCTNVAFGSGAAIGFSIRHSEIVHCSGLTGLGRGCFKLQIKIFDVRAQTPPQEFGAPNSDGMRERRAFGARFSDSLERERVSKQPRP